MDQGIEKGRVGTMMQSRPEKIDDRRPVDKMRLQELRDIAAANGFRDAIDRNLRSQGHGGQNSKGEPISAFDTVSKDVFLRAFNGVAAMDPADLAALKDRDRFNITVAEELIAEEREKFEGMRMFEVRALAKELGIAVQNTDPKRDLLDQIYKILEA